MLCKRWGSGKLAAAKLSDDLKHLISEPIELFRADDAPWAKGNKHCIIDGCYIYRTKENELLMLWSNFNADGYCVGIARSEDGTITGKWVQEKPPSILKKSQEFMMGDME